jgi:aminomethyltransferase
VSGQTHLNKSFNLPVVDGSGMAPRKPPLYEVHAARGATFTGFGGWDMPVEFDSIRVEHEAVRESAGLFDVSHMGRIAVSGPDGGTLTDRLTTNDVAALDPGEAQYSTITDEDGTMLDDTVVYRLPEPDADEYLFVPNAGHDAEMVARWSEHRDEWGLDATVENRTETTAMFAVQGPEAVEHVAEAFGGQVRDLAWFEATRAHLEAREEVEALVSRTGYTGEDGFEVICPVPAVESVHGALDVQPCGLGARDTLRIEAGLLLAGQDFHPEEDPRNPYEAGLGFVVDLDTEFVGRDALAAVAEEGVAERIVGFSLTEPGVPRHGYDIADREGKVIGTVTSGTMSPTLDEPVGMGYLPVEHADPDTEIRVVIRGREKNARTRALPFYRRNQDT